MRPVVVLGGDGAVGREVVAGLLGHVPEVVVAGRDLGEGGILPELAEHGFELAQYDAG